MSKRYCLNCNSDQEVTIINVSRLINIRGKSIQVEVSEAECNNCHERFEDEEIIRNNETIIFNEYRRINNLLYPYQIKDIRLKLGLSQREFSLLLGFGEKTIARYESGSIQDVPHDYLIRFSENLNNFSEVLFDSKNQLFSQIYKEFNKDMIDYASSNGILFKDMVQVPAKRVKIKKTVIKISSPVHFAQENYYSVSNDQTSGSKQNNLSMDNVCHLLNAGA